MASPSRRAISIRRLSPSVRLKSTICVLPCEFGSKSGHAFERPEGARIAVPHLDRMGTDKAVAAESLQRFVDDRHGLLARVRESELGMPRRLLARLDGPGRAPRHPPHRLDRHVHVDQAKGDNL